MLVVAVARWVDFGLCGNERETDDYSWSTNVDESESVPLHLKIPLDSLCRMHRISRPRHIYKINLLLTTRPLSIISLCLF